MAKLISSKNKIRPKTDILSGEYRGYGEVEVAISEGITKIRSYAFEDCTNLEIVHCPESLERIDENAFYNCPNLKKIIIKEGQDKRVYFQMAGSTDLIKLGLPYILGDSVKKGHPIEIKPSPF